MPLHLVKLCVGADSIADLQQRIAERSADKRARGVADEHTHRTRMVPKRAAELVDGGSLYWVIKGQIVAREGIVAIRPLTDAQGIARCDIVLDSHVVPVTPRPRRPFQGWRYLPAEEAPPDLGKRRKAVEAMPEALRRELGSLGLL